MNKAYSRRSVLAAPVALASLALGPSSKFAEDQPDYPLKQRDYRKKMALRSDHARMIGPVDEQMMQDEQKTYWENLIDKKLTSFSVTATFVNPLSGTDTLWDFGLCFHWERGPDGQLRQMETVNVDSSGWCYYAPWPDGGVAGDVRVKYFDDAPGATTTIDLWVVEQTAIVGINGRYQATLDPLVKPVVASGVAVGTGFFPEVRQPGRIIGVKDFSVWRIDVVGAA